MTDHRIRLTDADIALIVRALYARAAMLSAADRHRARRLAERLDDIAVGNPRWRLDPVTQGEWKSMQAARREIGVEVVNAMGEPLAADIWRDSGGE